MKLRVVWDVIRCISHRFFQTRKCQERRRKRKGVKRQTRRLSEVKTQGEWWWVAAVHVYGKEMERESLRKREIKNEEGGSTSSIRRRYRTRLDNESVSIDTGLGFLVLNLLFFQAAYNKGH